MKRSIDRQPTMESQAQKRSKTEMENLRRKRLNNEFQKTRDIVDARRPNLNCKMEQGDILEQMRDLFLTTEQQLKEREAQLAQFQQNFVALCGQSFTQGFNLGKTFSQLEPFINKSNNQTTQPTYDHTQMILNLILQQCNQQQQTGQGSDAELSLNNQSTDDSGINLSFSSNANNSPK